MMTEQLLPKGWKWKTLKQVCKTTSGGTPSRKQPEYYTGTIPWVKSGELKYGKILYTEEYITEEAVNNSSAKVFPKGTLLIALYGATVGRMATLGVNAATNQAVCALFPKDELNHQYLYWFLFFRRPVLLENRVGGAQPNISQTVLQDLTLPVPPLPIQRQIVARIEELFSGVDAGVKELQTALQRLKTYRQALLHHYLSNKEWKRVEIGQLCKCIVPNRDKPKSFTGHIPWITIPDLNDECVTIDYSDVTLGLTEQEAHESKAKIIPTGSVIMTCVGRFGIAAVVDKPLVINQQLHAFRPTDSFLPKFIAYNIIYNKQFFEQQATATTIAYINKSKCNSMPLPVISTDSQSQIVDEIEFKFSEADAMETTIRESLTKAEALRQSILKRAFEGKLVSGNQDEFVEVLTVPAVPTTVPTGQAEQMRLFN